MKNFINALVSNSIKIIFGIFLAAIVIFMWQNWNSLTGPLTLKFIGSAQYPLWIWLVAVFIAGNISWGLLNMKSKRHLKKTLNQNSLELKTTKMELNKYRNLSIKDDTSAPESDTGDRNNSDEKED